MGMQRVFGMIGVTMFLCVIPPMLESTEPRGGGVPPAVHALPVEPDEFDRREVDAYYDWRNNMFFRVFKLASQESKPDFMTARRTYKVSVNQYGYEVAITFANPLFYWVDLDGNGEFEPGKGEMWIDVKKMASTGTNGSTTRWRRVRGPAGRCPSLRLQQADRDSLYEFCRGTARRAPTDPIRAESTMAKLDQRTLTNQ